MGGGGGGGEGGGILATGHHPSHVALHRRILTVLGLLLGRKLKWGRGRVREYIASIPSPLCSENLAC